MKKLIGFYLAVFFRRIHYFLVVFLLFTFASVTVSRLLPSSYVSEARLLVEAPQIPLELAAATVSIDASVQLQIIEQRLLTRANLLDIARRLNVFEDMSKMSADEIVASMRSAAKINRSGGRGQATFMLISFESESASIAANVANEFVTLVLKDNVELRTDRAGETLEFFEQEVARLNGELADQSARILAFKTENSDALPDSLEFRLNQQSRLLDRQSSLEREISSLREQKQRLIQIFETTGQIATSQQENQTPEEIKLAQLQRDLQNALIIYSPDNPKVRVLEAQVAQTQSLIAAANGGGQNDVSQSSLLDIQLAEIDTRSDLIREEISRIEVELGDLKDSINRTPANSIQLSSFERDYSNIQSQYNVAVDRLAKAATGERIELLSKGQRIAVLDAATVPSRPTKPNRTLIAAMGSLAGAGLGLALIVLLELLKNAVRRPSDITKKLGVTPIATVPYVRTPMELVVRRAILVGVFATIIVGIPAVLYYLHLNYLPLDLIYDRIAAKVTGLI